MTITVAKLKRALEETAERILPDEQAHYDCKELALSPTALTILAEKLSERPAPLVMDQRKDAVGINYIARKDCPTQLGDACKQGQRCCQRNPEWIASGEPDVMPTDEDRYGSHGQG